MELERRGRADQGHLEVNPQGEEPTGRPQPKVKSFEISKRLIYEAWEKVRANRGAPGVDAVSIAEFGGKERNNLYKLWNRMSSGSYLPGPVRAVEIPKDHGAGVRTLGVPNTADRVAVAAATMLVRRDSISDIGQRFRSTDMPSPTAGRTPMPWELTVSRSAAASIALVDSRMAAPVRYVRQR